ncbi:response regulator [Rheinheimera sp. MM224]|uniref:ATP-binding response regulator n=1 Tax=Rheinheimera sp. MM224 TaxID=3019969 RepID=UPI0021F89DC6|nr:response regulator [Rheinheimera sp. MM224]CAI3805100.1 Regulator of RpoS [Rheinheimera sp. MM224]
MERQWQVLVIDDFAPMRNTIRSGLEQSGLYNVFVLSSTNQIWPLLENEKIDLVICDINIPGQSGLELLEMVRGHHQYSNLPFMLMTGDGSKQIVAQAIALRVNDFVVKPFTLNLLKERVTSVLQRKSRAPLASAQLPDQQLTEATIPFINAKPTILVVDDEPTNLELLFNLLKDHYNIKVANNGKKALSIVSSDSPPDLILLDIMMPDMDGYEVCETLMNNTSHDIPVIFVSAKTEVADVTKGFALGAVDYVFKPLQPEILQARIRTQLALRDARVQLRRTIDALLENARIKQDMEHITQHDVKSPLSSLLMQLTLLLEDPQLAAQYKEQLSQMRRSAQMALGLVGQGTDLLKMENGTYQLQAEPVEVEPLLKQVQLDLSEQIQQKHLQISFKFFVKNPVVKGEEQLCYFIFSNLLKNAVEAAPARSEVMISVEELHDSVTIRFYNEGAVPEGIRESLFDKYVTSGKEEGTGLGSYSARMMTLVQNGDVSFKVLNNAKTVFTVSLPRITSSH